MGWVDADSLDADAGAKPLPEKFAKDKIKTDIPVMEPGGATVSYKPPPGAGRWVDVDDAAAGVSPPPGASAPPQDNGNGGKLPLEPEEQKALGGGVDLTPESTGGKLALQGSHGFLGNTLPAILGALPGGLTREDWANALNNSREATGIPGRIVEAGGAIANPLMRAGGVAGNAAIGGALGAGEAASQGGDLTDIAKNAGLNALIGGGVSGALSGIGKAFPWIADRLAERQTGQTARDVAARVRGTAGGKFPAGDYANTVNELGLNRVTPGGVVRAAEAVKEGAGEALGKMREGLTATAEEIRQAVGNHPAVKNLLDALGIKEASPLAGRVTSGIASPSGEAVAGKVSSAVLEKNPALAAFLKGAAAKTEQGVESVSLNDLADATNLHVNNPLGQMQRAAAVPGPIVDSGAQQALLVAKQNLNKLQDAKVLASGVEPGAYDAARKTYAVAEGASRGGAKQVGRAVAGHGVRAMIGGAIGGPVGFAVGGAVGTRPAAYAALQAYKAARSAPALALGKAAKATAPGVQQAVARATASGEPSQAGVAIQKAQANDPAARETED